ncbi:hypothetical protein [Mesorhizobium sp. IMUNJ 23232]|uniref:hypothetical protein n=1 Tax=Mesorhizobium sp. IMUNJ 23232 TaxID=3376064 RepID=UPI0037B1850D
MAKMNIYVGDELKMRMDALPNQNWSAVAQEAFELQIATAPKENMNMDDVIERLRASKQKSEEQTKPYWKGQGREWAMKTAEADALENVGELEYSDADSADELLNMIVGAITDDEPDYNAIVEFCEEVLTGEHPRTKKPSKRIIMWWLEGAQEIWAEVQDKI